MRIISESPGLFVGELSSRFYGIDSMILELNDIKQKYPDYNMSISVEKEYVDVRGQKDFCPLCELSYPVLMIRGGKKKIE